MSSFILASASPRRSYLLEKAGFTFKIIPSEVDESLYESVGVCPLEHTKILAKAKAMDVALKHPEDYVLGSDCVVELDGVIIGKPEDREDAERIIRLLFASPHRVVTGISVINISKKIEIVLGESATVYPKVLSEEQVKAHLDGGQWRGKAGGYGIQECGDEFVQRVEGSFTNVMGLPMELTTSVLAELGIFPEK